jgi:homopolymeric O-antigen transport system permease protein
MGNGMQHSKGLGFQVASMVAMIKATWQYRGFIVSAVINDFRTRLSHTRFGVAWIVLQPLAQVLIFATILSNVLGSRLSGSDSKYGYVVYLMAGTACWSLFTDIVQRCVTVFIDNGSLLKKIQFPRIALPAVVVGIASVNNLAYLAIVLSVLPVLAVYPGVHYLWLPLLMVMTIGLAAGIGLFLGTLNVFARDIGQVVSVLIQFWFWMTPIVYPVSIVPPAFRSTLAFNPVLPLVVGYQNVLLYRTAPPAQLRWLVLVVLVVLAAAMFVFRRASSEMVDVL